MIEAEELKEILKKDERYKDFTVLDKPVVFKEYFAGQDIDVVQLRAICTFDHESNNSNNTEVVFSGAFSWKDSVVKSLDGDSYSSDMKVYGYEYWANEEENIDKGLDILVESDWMVIRVS